MFHKQNTDSFDGNVVGLEMFLAGLLFDNHTDLLVMDGVQSSQKQQQQ